jgi:hypothetical protein
MAVGERTSAVGILMPITNGVPGTVQTVPGTTALEAIACIDASSCLAVGESSSGIDGVVMPITNGVPRTVATVPGILDLAGVACATTTFCVAVGTIQSGSACVVVTITNEASGTPQP